MQDIGAYIMGRNMFGAGRGAVGRDRGRGWWGEDPPFHTPVFVLTHHAREPLEMQGGTTFHFVTDGIESALEQARGGGRRAGRLDRRRRRAPCSQYLAAGLLDEMHAAHRPGRPRRRASGCWIGVGDPKLEPIEVVASPAVTHVKYRVE